MGRRSRKRRLPESVAAAPGATPRAAKTATARDPGRAAPRATPANPRRRARLDEAPKAPWSPFPLIELCILIGIVLLVVGFVTHGHRGRVELGGGFAVLLLAVCVQTVNEHFAGYRSHSALLAGVAAVALDAILYLATPIPQTALVAIGVVVFALVMRTLRAAFMRRTGGLGFRA